MRGIDLHAHTKKSDGTYSPAELAAYGISKGLQALAVTDHDTIDGVDEAMLAAQGSGMEVIPGIECSANYLDKDIHILGLYLEHRNEDLLSGLNRLQQKRDRRNALMIDKLQAHGIVVEPATLAARFPACILTRAHFARFLLDEGHVKSLAEAYDRYVGDHASCFVHKEASGPEEMITLIRKAGGVPILAHPLLYGFSARDLEIMIREFVSIGLQGMEVIYSTHSASDMRYLQAMAQRNNLIISGGSDFHGTNKKDIDLGCGRGNLQVPEEILSPIKALSARSDKK